MKKRRNNFIYLAVFILLTFIMITVLLIRKDDPSQENVFPTVKVDEVSADFATNNYELVGKIMGEKETNIAPKISGRIKKIKKNTGDYVKKNEVLAIIDGDEILTRLKNAEKILENADEALDDTEDYYEELVDDAEEEYDAVKKKYEKVKNSGTSTEEDFENAKNEYKIAKEKLETAEQMEETQVEVAKGSFIQAENNLNSVKEAVSNLHLRAPFSGVITNKLLEEGSMTSPMNPVFSISQDQVKLVVFEADKTVAGELMENKQLNVFNEEEICIANVTLIAPKLETETQKQKVEARFLNSDCKLKLGSLVNVNIGSISNSQSIIIPIDSIVKFYHDNTVFVVRKKGDDYLVERKIIEIGKVYDDKVEVISGVGIGEKIVVEGQFYLGNNDKVLIYE